MIKLNKDIGENLARNPGFGYSCDHGACIGDDVEFIIWHEGNEYFLVHNSELIQEGFLVKLKKEIK